MEKMYQIGLWPGIGYYRELFNMSGTCEEDATDNLVTYLVNNNIGEGRYWKELESLEREYSEEEIEEMGFTYIDATMNGANRPVYLLTMEMTIKQIEATHNTPRIWKQQNGFYLRKAEELYVISI